MREITIGENDSGQRLDRFLDKYLPKASSSFLQKMIRTKKIKCNKKRAKPSQMIKEGDRIQFYLYEEVLRPLEEDKKIPKSKISLSIVYEDDDIAVIDKPAGLLSHAATARDYGHNVVDAFVDLMIAKDEYQPRQEHSFKPALANRLDYNTAGLLIGLKNHRAAMAINQALASGKIQKYYLCYCAGKLDGEKTIDSELEKSGKTMKLSKNGKRAITRVSPIYVSKDFSYAEILLVTGRYHQIRAHMASIGHPLLGDKRYGKGEEFSGKTGPFKGQLLLSSKLHFLEVEGFPQLEDLTVESLQIQKFENIRHSLELA